MRFLGEIENLDTMLFFLTILRVFATLFEREDKLTFQMKDSALHRSCNKANWTEGRQ